MGVESGVNVINGFNQHVAENTSRLVNLGRFFESALPIVSDLTACNQRLSGAGRSDLAMTEQARMMEVSSPSEVLGKCNNFTPNFSIHTGYVEEDSQGSAYFGKNKKPIPITLEELTSLVKKKITFENSENWAILSHIIKPAFQRMLALFPDFTTSLVLKLSQSQEGYVYAESEPELFVAYQIMSNLVDVGDEYVVNEGEVDSWYLCR